MGNGKTLVSSRRSNAARPSPSWLPLAKTFTADIVAPQTSASLDAAPFSWNQSNEGVTPSTQPVPMANETGVATP